MSSLRSAPKTDALVSAAPTVEAVDSDEEAAKLTPTFSKLRLNARNLTKAELADGVTFDIGNEALSGKSIVSSWKLSSASTDSDAPINISVSLFENTSGKVVDAHTVGVENKVGWLPQDTAVPDGFTQLVSLHPCEANRYSDYTLYAPSNALSSRYIETYGNITPSTMQEAIVKLPNEDFCLVAKDSIVDQVCASNWELLGLSTPSEQVYHGSWLKLSNKVVDHVMGELKEAVLDRLAYSRLGSMQAHVAADPAAIDDLDDDVHYNVTAEFSIQHELQTD